MKVLTPNIKIFQEGDNKSLSVIFVHGFPFDHNMWKKQIDELSSDYFCISFDVRGLGESLPGDGQFTIELFVDDISSIINELGLKKPVICGLSMGGYISLRAVEKMESKFGGLILCDTKSEADTDKGKIVRAEGIKKINEEGLKNFIPEFIKNCFSERFRNDYQEEYLEIIKRSLQYSALGVKGCLLALAARTDTTSYLSEIKIPTLVLCGEKDSMTTPDIMRELAEKILNSEFHIVPNSGHMISIENYPFVTEEIFEFLKKIEEHI
jgi:3-oxoadipate enol-lactonase